MQKKRPYDAFYLCLLLIGGLLVFSLLPEFSAGSFFFKKVDLLSDLKVFEKEIERAGLRDKIIYLKHGEKYDFHSSEK